MAETETKEQLLHRLASRSKDELVDRLTSKLTKDDLVSLLGSRLRKDELAAALDEPPRSRESNRKHDEDERQEDEREAERDSRARSQAPPGAVVSMPGQRVRVDVSGLPMLGVFAGRGAAAAGTITDVDAGTGTLTVHLDAGFGGRKQVVVPPGRVRAEVS